MTCAVLSCPAPDASSTGSWSDMDDTCRAQDESSNRFNKPANVFGGERKPMLETWPFRDQLMSSPLAMTQMPSAEPTMDSLPSMDSWQSWDQSMDSGAVTGAHYFVPVMITAPCVPDTMSSAAFPNQKTANQERSATENPPPEWGNTTTVMMRNLPNKYTQRLLLADINEAGFIGTFDFLYLPIDTETNANKGYAFINFSEPGFAWMFKQAYEGRRMPRFNSDKVVSVFVATLQGFDANYAHYAHSRVNRGDPSCRPLFLREPNQNLTVKSLGRSGRRNGRGHGRSNLDQLAETQDLQRRLEAAVQAIVTKQQTQEKQGHQGQQSPPQQQVRFCPHCGSKSNPDFKFCPACGSSLGTSV